MAEKTIILGAGITGLAAGIATGYPIYEALACPGGICLSYYKDGFRFEKGGGHWIFGTDNEVWKFLLDYVFLPQRYERWAGIYFQESGEIVPYPIQNQVEIKDHYEGPVVTMKDWLAAQFGESLCHRFFYPFHESYTAGLYKTVAPQDPQKSPVKGKGYNASFIYPQEGLDFLTQRMAADCTVDYDKKVEGIDPKAKKVSFEDGSLIPYDRIISTLPLNVMANIAGLKADPHTSVAVLNIGAKKGPHCPKEHWLYIPKSENGFHRVGFYSNVDANFLPKKKIDLVSLYVERSLLPDEPLPAGYADAVISELQSWGFIGEVVTKDLNMIPVAYTYTMPGSTWRQDALDILAEYGIYQAGRFARWQFQGIAESIKEGLSWRFR